MQERRKHLRLIKKLPLKVRAGSFDLVTETQNISLSGVCCQVDKFIQPMTKVELLLLLPLRLKNDKITTRRLGLEGVIVRAEPAKDTQGKFNIAIFFNNMKETDKINLNRYIASHTQS
ncbi:MAG: hypothetical protein A3G37_00635 [Omnitrophica WOR_2 bacterium RIFCSPLOWO2_12_FULL_46_30]|nr:MAG: hypothetical protein A3D27_02880 [Omnitrophica WOR_2 bacterium RIFCSPHIGHO2_02_FULL_46_37]OGX43872.1 MAG: hypothetical protein A3H41_04580 [Omnitrophica WOR_2 bacterium RIFCSPLOWO2_02_FULL_45_28]OGX51280.1 MAG: hypothetical protein A3G37_00635 [Omnitrophica WOR_2 bacterium RIFCSPLOWO2_12_FULL_46_30]